MDRQWGKTHKQIHTEFRHRTIAKYNDTPFAFRLRLLLLLLLQPSRKIERSE
jgi:hypothetical protein